MYHKNNIRYCFNCKSNKTYIEKDGHEHWHNYKDGFLCHKCYKKLIEKPRRLRFKEKRVYLKENPRKGICVLCNKQGLTHIHHIKYHDLEPLKDTIELCVSCHNKQRSIIS